jgi:hypothetical protein
MQSTRQRTIVYWAFVVVVCLGLTLDRPKPDFITIDFGTLASGYGGLLIGLGGFSITVLAVLLGLEALDSGGARSKAHMAAVRHVAISLAIASIGCFVGSSLMSEVNALSVSINARKAAIATEVEEGLRYEGVTEKKLGQVRSIFASPPASGPPLERLRQAFAGITGPSAFIEKRASEIEGVTGASVRRHFMLAGLSTYLASFLILQSLSFLLLIRFPQSRRLFALQNLAVLGIGGMLLIKLLHTTAYNEPGVGFYFDRLLVFSILAAVVVGYAPRMRRSMEGADRTEYTPLFPYYVTLGVCIVSMFWLAATFGSYVMPSFLDRFIITVGATLSTGLMLVMQLEQPTIELLRRNDESAN